MSRMTLEDEADLHALAAVQCDEADPTHCALCAARALLAVAPEPQTAAHVGEMERRLGAARLAADEEEVAIEQRLKQRRSDADRAMVELERTHGERRGELQAEEAALVSRVQALRDELRGLAAKAGAL